MNRKKQARQKSALKRHLASMIALKACEHEYSKVVSEKKKLSFIKDKISKLNVCIENTYKNLDNSIRSMR